MQDDLVSPFLALCVGDGTLNANKARKIWPGLESVPWAALSEIESVSGAAFCRPPLASSGRMDRPESLKGSTLRARQYTDLEAAL
jgi:hypothetical protein